MNAQAFADHCRFERRTLWHVSFACHEGLEGPLVLGDGRYVGLGLMRPVLESPSILEFSLTDGLNESTAPKPVAIAARRAMMARVQAQMRSDARLPTYVSGHRADGRPAGGNGRHEHIAVVADLPGAASCSWPPAKSTAETQAGRNWQRYTLTRRQRSEAWTFCTPERATG